jgi:cytochrome P450
MSQVSLSDSALEHEPAPQLPPLAPGWPFLGVAWQMRRRPLPYMLKMLRDAGTDVIRMKLGPYHATLFRNPEHIRRIFVDNAANYTKQTRGYAKARISLGDGLVTSEGELWQRQRRIATPAFSRQRIAGFAGMMTDATTRMLDEWRARSRDAQPLDVFQEMMRLTLQIALQTLMGVTAEREIGELSGAVTEVLERTNDIITNPFSLPPSIPTPRSRRFKRAIETLDRFVYETIARRRAEGASSSRPDDLLSMLLNARDEETGQGMSDKQLRDEAVTILIAGHETTANALTWAFYLLSENPRTFEALRSELTLALNGRVPTFDDLPKLPYARAVFEESMRLYPPAWMIGRCAKSQDTIGNYLVPAGTFVLVSPYVTHRHPALWDNPDQFDPSRFIDGRADALAKFAYVPFGGGQRFCIGSNFALMEGTLLLATIAQACRLTTDAGFIPEPYAMITLRPKTGLPMTAVWDT